MRLRTEAGFTLPEVLVVLAILPVALLALLKTLDTTGQLAPRSVQHATAVGEAGSGFSRALRDIRQAYRVVGTTPNSMTFYAVVNGADTQVNIACDVASPADGGAAYRRCVRTTAAIGAALPSPTRGTVLVDRLINGTVGDPVFTYTPNPISPTFVRMQIRVPSRGEGSAGNTHPITIDNGTLLRNNALGS
jgi:prepilin-type N-terminal cleavage/methylation domain-containing protein